jgi:hypothetical protein
MSPIHRFLAAAFVAVFIVGLALLSPSSARAATPCWWGGWIEKTATYYDYDQDGDGSRDASQSSTVRYRVGYSCQNSPLYIHVYRISTTYRYNEHVDWTGGPHTAVLRTHGVWRTGSSVQVEYFPNYSCSGQCVKTHIAYPDTTFAYSTSAHKYLYTSSARSSVGGWVLRHYFAGSNNYIQNTCDRCP